MTLQTPEVQETITGTASERRIEGQRKESNGKLMKMYEGGWGTASDIAGKTAEVAGTTAVLGGVLIAKTVGGLAKGVARGISTVWDRSMSA